MDAEDTVDDSLLVPDRGSDPSVVIAGSGARLRIQQLGTLDNVPLRTLSFLTGAVCCSTLFGLAIRA